jgi:hypothetical protein
MRQPFPDAIILFQEKKIRDRGEWMVLSSNFMRWCGIAAIVGAIAYTLLSLLGRLYIYLYAPSVPWDVPPVLSYIERMLPLLLLLGVAAAIAGLHRGQSERYGLLGTLASLTALRWRGSHCRGLDCGSLSGPGLRTLASVSHLGFIDSKLGPRGSRGRDHGS